MHGGANLGLFWTWFADGQDAINKYSNLVVVVDTQERAMACWCRHSREPETGLTPSRLGQLLSLDGLEADMGLDFLRTVKVSRAQARRCHHVKRG